MLLPVLVLIVVVPLVMITIGIYISGPRYEGPVSDHFNGSKFTNPGEVKAKGMLDVMKWMFSRKREPLEDLPMENYGKRPLGHFRDGIRITFVNHSTFLIQVDGLNILTDPIWSKRTSPFTWIGPKRVRYPGIRFEDLPTIHAVIISHNHYDHLDLQTMRMLFGAHHPRVMTPLGVKSFLDQELITGATEIDWWVEETLSEQVTIQSVPAQHFSGRGLLDRDATLWSGFVIKTSKGNIYFAGDTGYNEKTFRQIGARCSPIKISLLPIGAYKPAWFMSPIHISPGESVKIHRDLRSETSIAMHFGTFPLADDGYEEPVHDLRLAMDEYKLRPEEFLVLKEGEAWVFEW